METSNIDSHCSVEACPVQIKFEIDSTLKQKMEVSLNRANLFIRVKVKDEYSAKKEI